ncbi:hypothetical protein [Methylomonas rivi]|uniref:Uncharacterized protein n=1 Tax=Methylomonas rivi TaxID=2952226 RepID=A0ABT1U432_9GAMM|nr:hypothetical protein [Methylomonas sp. WSC-6]MCQ8128313.1 hypothetical protein [Methylomonas sp. WSC-6]
MAYNRSYSLQDTANILNASEGRPRPGVPLTKAESGHAISLHTRERVDSFSRPKKKNGKDAKLPREDSIFLVDRHSLVSMVHEALNSRSGQSELERLNEPDVSSVEIQSVVLRQGKDFDIFTVYRPKKGQMSFDWASVVKGDGYIVLIYILVCKIPNSSSQEIHIQTAFPKDYARTQGDEIFRDTPRPGSKHYK